MAVDANSHDIVAVQVTHNDVGDNEALGELLDQIDEPIESVAGDGAYDARANYQEIAQCDAKALIAPRKGAKIWQHGNRKTARHNRDKNLRAVRKKGMKQWKQDSGYQRRSLAETAIFRFKQLMGDTLSSRCFDNQCVELIIRCAAINGMTVLGMPKSEPIG